METFESKEFGFSIRYPRSWQKISAKEPTAVVFRDLSDETKVASVNVIVEDVPPDMDLETFTSSLDSVPGPQKRLWDHEFCGIAGKRCLYTASLSPEHTFQVLQSWTLYKSQAYVITYTANLRDFEDRREVVVNMFDSMNFIDATPLDKRPIKTVWLETLVDTTSHYSMKHPIGNWRRTSNDSGIIEEFAYSGPLTPKETTPINLRIQVSISDFPSDDLNMAISYIKRRISTLPDHGDIIQHKLQLGDQPAISLKYHSTLEDVRATFVQVCTLRGKQLFKVLFMDTCEPESRFRVEPLFHAVLNSVEFTEGKEDVGINATFENQKIPTRATAGFYTFTNLDLGIQFSCPKKNWMPSESMGAVVIFERKANEAAQPTSTVSLLVVEMGDSGLDTIDQVRAELLQELKFSLSDAEEVEAKKVTWQGYDALDIVYNGKVNAQDVYISHRLIIAEKRAYVIAFNCLKHEATKEHTYARKVINSFQILSARK